LERQVLDGELIAAAVAEAGREEPALDAIARAGLTELLGELAVV
jgi:hypothetical protein